MTKAEFEGLQPGDVIRGKSSFMTYIVTQTFKDRVTAVRTIDLTNHVEWDLIAKSQLEFLNII